MWSILEKMPQGAEGLKGTNPYPSASLELNVFFAQNNSTLWSSLSLESCEEARWLLGLSLVSLGKWEQFHTDHHAHSGHYEICRVHTLSRRCWKFSSPFLEEGARLSLPNSCTVAVHPVWVWADGLECSGWLPERQREEESFWLFTKFVESWFHVERGPMGCGIQRPHCPEPITSNPWPFDFIPFKAK